MRSPSRSATRYLFALAPAILLLVSAGCAFAPSATEEPSTTTSSTSPGSAPTAPWESGAGPTIAIEFDLQGEFRTVMGQLAPEGLLSCEKRVVVSNKSPNPGLGVMFSAENSDDDILNTWVVGEELVAQFLGSGHVNTETHDDGTVTYSVIAAPGEATVLLRDPATTSIGDHDMQGAPRVAATTSFTVTCPAP